MIADIISIATIMLCTFVAATVIGIFLLQVWLTDRRHASAGYWCLSMLIGALCTALFALRPVAPTLLSVGLGNAFAAMAYSLMWAGFRVFDGRRASTAVIWFGPLLWSASYLFIPPVTNDVNNRVILMSALISLYTIWIARDIRQARHTDPLPTRLIATILFATHSAVYFLRIPMTILSPTKLDHGTAFSTWFALFSLELFAHTILAAIAMLVLIKERGEALYRRASRTDALTGIPNRASFLDDVGRRLLVSPWGTLMIFDLDNFKSINDTHGHMAGDDALRGFTTRISGLLSQDMLFCRLGGEEFALFMPGDDRDLGMLHAERLRAAVAAAPMRSGRRLIPVTVSIGVSDTATFGRDIDRLQSAADRALYVAKAAGRNRVVHAASQGNLAEFAQRLRTPPADMPDAAAS